ncbi:hypothetical protein MUU74_07845 [Chryseobacterium daecheongense]|uniref:hypothetical protein n=1 Tax=Chryseobacterium daecheongense TaxID=192389 RepID=UPI001FD65389|nr:hypothetical protein [Chryseobacterium daecheongense]UOU99853.1 hypothetical protein MUU74_07845 [Chryseobacterium daecheongense]
MPFLFSCRSVFYNHLFLSLLYPIKYHDTVQWSVQSIAALGHKKHKFYYIMAVWQEVQAGFLLLRPVKNYKKNITIKEYEDNKIS